MSICDCCDEDWPDDFFCDKCGNTPVLTEVTQPIVMWDYSGSDIETVEDYRFYSVCLNCCMGHPK